MISTLENNTGKSNPLAEIEKRAEKFAFEHKHLSGIVTDFEDEVAKLRKRFFPRMRTAVAEASKAKQELFAALTAAPELFESPRTVEFSRIKVGYKKGKGSIDWDDDELLCKRIDKHFDKDQAELLIKTTRKPIYTALEDLEVGDLKKLGCRVEGTSDVIVIKVMDSEIDKVVTALLKNATEEEVAA